MRWVNSGVSQEGLYLEEKKKEKKEKRKNSTKGPIKELKEKKEEKEIGLKTYKILFKYL